MINIPHIQCEFIFPRQGIAPVDLRPASDARLDLMTAHLLRSVAIQVLHQQGARPDQAHVSLQDVEQLWKLIHAGAAQESPERGEALLIGQETAICIARIGHCAELEQDEGSAVKSGALLTEENGGTKPDPHEERDYDQDGREQSKCEYRQDQINKTLPAVPIESVQAFSLSTNRLTSSANASACWRLSKCSTT